MNFARPLYQAGLLSREPEKINGQEIIPYDLVLRHLPPAPKTEDEIRQILNEGLISDDGYMEVSAIGKDVYKRQACERGHSLQALLDP